MDHAVHRALARLGERARMDPKVPAVMLLGSQSHGGRPGIGRRRVSRADEAVIDTCALLVTGLRLGLPAEPGDLFDKLAGDGRLTPAVARRLTDKKVRNIQVHEYGHVDDHRVFRTLQGDLADDTFRGEILPALPDQDRRRPSGC